MTNSRRKGKVGENEIVNLLKSYGLTARRGQQFKGTPDSPDVIVEEWPDLHIEVKRAERFNLYSAMKQAREDKGDNQCPVVFHRRNKEGWVAVMELECFVDLVGRSDIGEESHE